MEKKCKKCNVVKDVCEFGKRKDAKDGLRNHCKRCRKEYQTDYKKNKTSIAENKDKDKKAKLALFKEGNKKCSKCAIIKNVSEYYKAANSKDGFGMICIECDKEKGRKYDNTNKEKVSDRKRIYRNNNKGLFRERNRQYEEANKEKIAERKRIYYKANKDRIIKRGTRYETSRRKIDALYRLRKNIRMNVKRYLIYGKSKSTKEIIGIDYKEFQDYLEVEYTENMHLDHIIPLSWAINDEEVYTLNHYSNFQIITAEENMAKSDSYCKSENLKKVLDNHNDLTKLNQIIERNSDKIK